MQLFRDFDNVTSSCVPGILLICFLIQVYEQLVTDFQVQGSPSGELARCTTAEEAIKVPQVNAIINPFWIRQRIDPSTY